jgi:hypothetical protein
VTAHAPALTPSPERPPPYHSTSQRHGHPSSFAPLNNATANLIPVSPHVIPCLSLGLSSQQLLCNTSPPAVSPSHIPNEHACCSISLLVRPPTFLLAASSSSTVSAAPLRLEIGWQYFYDVALSATHPADAAAIRPFLQIPRRCITLPPQLHTILAVEVVSPHYAPWGFETIVLVSDKVVVPPTIDLSHNSRKIICE